MVAKTDFVHMAFPPTFVHPYTATDKNGKTWDKAIITMPRNTFLNNRDIAYYNLDVFMNDHMSEQKQQGKNVIVNVREDQPLELFKGKGELRQTILIEDPWKLAKAIKHARETYTDKDKTEGGVQDMLTVTVTSPHIHGYEQPVTLPLNQAITSSHASMISSAMCVFAIQQTPGKTSLPALSRQTNRNIQSSCISVTGIEG